MLVRLLYASRAAEPLSAGVIDDILSRSRKNNPALGVTGLLCYSDDIFMQLLEGGRDEVCDLYNAIVRDTRHQNVRLLSFEEISERRFGSWIMGQVQLTKINPAMLLKYFPRAILDPFSANGHATMSLLHELAATAAFVSRGD